MAVYRGPDRWMTFKTLLLTALAMLAFAGNSLLCRAALRDSQIDPASFTALRLFAGAVVLWLLLKVVVLHWVPSWVVSLT